MPRPQRIEYEHAFYHVMNRARGRRIIFHDDVYYQMFLDTLGEACFRFDCLVHAYCLIDSHYHILIETSKANLSRLMRHVNGVYTQRYNRLNESDGPLFRGRFKAVLVDHNDYLLPISRYIHRQPIDMKKPLVTQLSDYRWSSYPAYVGKAQPDQWLAQDLTFNKLGHKGNHNGYANYVMAGVDEQTAQLYSKGNMASVIGDKGFRAWVYQKRSPQLAAERESQLSQPDLTMAQVICLIANEYGVTADDITKVVRGLQKENEARKLAMYLCQELVAAKLADIAIHFHLNNTGSVGFTTHQVRQRIRSDSQFKHRVDALIKRIMALTL
jgi:putative transposase